MRTVRPSDFVEYARRVLNWTMRDVLDYLESASAPVLDYPADADTELMRITDDANRAAAMIYMGGYAFTPGTTEAATRALEFVGGAA